MANWLSCKTVQDLCHIGIASDRSTLSTLEHIKIIIIVNSLVILAKSMYQCGNILYFGPTIIIKIAGNNATYTAPAAKFDA